MIAADLRKRRPKPWTTRHLDEVYLEIRRPHGLSLARRGCYEGEALDAGVQSRRNKRAALKLMRKLLKKYGCLSQTSSSRTISNLSAAAAKNLVSQDDDERGSVVQQSSGELASTDPTTRIQDAAFQTSGVSRKDFFSTLAATYLQHFNVQRYLISAKTHRAFVRRLTNMGHEAVAVA